MRVVISHGPAQVDNLCKHTFMKAFYFQTIWNKILAVILFHPLSAAAASSFFNELLCTSVFSQRVLTVANRCIKHLWWLTVTVSSMWGRSSLFPLGEPWTSNRMIRMPVNSKLLRCSHFSQVFPLDGGGLIWWSS